MKKFYMTFGRERDLIRYSENSDLKDAKEYSEERALEILMINGYTETKARSFIESVKKNPFGDWIEWK